MKFLEDMLEKQYGIEIAQKIIKGYLAKRKTTLRINTIKSNIEEIKQKLDAKKIEYEEVKWSKEAIIIKNEDEKAIQKMDIYTNGEIYMQSLSSMLPPIILEPKEGTDILDMAAAPGGKTTQIAALTNNKAHITACEKNKIREERLKYNIDKQGASCVFIMQKDARFIDDFFSFDQILLDAPCSGSGTLDFNDNNIEKYFSKQEPVLFPVYNPYKYFAIPIAWFHRLMIPDLPVQHLHWNPALRILPDPHQIRDPALLPGSSPTDRDQSLRKEYLPHQQASHQN